jgi:hypothetical protein
MYQKATDRDEVDAVALDIAGVKIQTLLRTASQAR